MATDLDVSPEKVWKAVLSHLLGGMAIADFNVYLKEASLIDFSGEVFVIGCPNPYARDWLESRLTSTIQRSLTGLLGQEAKVKFIVRDPTPKELPDEDAPIVMDIRESSIRNSLLEPGRVVAFPVYYLRWLPYVGAQTIFLVMALWQEYFLASSGKARSGKCKVSVRAERICQWAGISRSQFFRIFQSNQDLDWFIRRLDTAHEVDRQTGRTKKSTNKYQLFEFPLTPGDAEALRAYLLAAGIKEAPEAVLREAAGRPPKEILHFPSERVAGFHETRPNPQTVQDVIRELLDHRLEGTLAELSDQLAARILAEGDFLLVSWYFLKNWLPLLGPDASMFVLYLRYNCFFNDQTGEVRDEVWMEGGYETIANRLGIHNPREVANWLPARIERGKKKESLSRRTREEFARRQRLQDSLALFLTRVDHRLSPTGVFSWKFRVKRTDPLTPQDQALVSAATRLLKGAQKEGVMEEFSAWIEQNHPSSGEGKIVLGLSDFLKGCSETLARLLNDCFETLDGTANDCFATLLKILKSFKDSQNNQNTSLPQDSTDEGIDELGRWVVEVTDAGGNWSLERLLSRVDRKNRTEIISREKDALPFLSWVIYGASQNAIRDPLSLAVARLKENPGVDAGGASSRLAELSPRDLALLVRQSLAGTSPAHPDWRLLFGEVNESRIRLLADALKASVYVRVGS